MAVRSMMSLFVAALAAATAVAAPAAPPPPSIVVGLEEGWPEVRAYDRFGVQSQMWTQQGNAWPFQLPAYPTYEKGVRVAIGDVVGDGRPEIVTAPGGDDWTDINVFDSRTFERVQTFPSIPFLNSWTGAFVAAGDVAGDAKAEAVVGLDRGCCTTVGVWDARSPARVAAFFPFDPNMQAGVRVAVGDIGGDAKREVLAAGIGSGIVSAFSGTGPTAFRTYSPFAGRGAVLSAVTAGDVAGDSRAEVIAYGQTADGPELRVLDAASGNVIASLAPYLPRTGFDVSLATGDVDGDGVGEVVVAARSASGTQIFALSTTGRVVSSFFVTDPSIAPGASGAAADLDGDGKAEIVVGSGPTRKPAPPYAGPDQRVAVFDGTGRELGAFAAYPGSHQGGVRVAEADVAGDAAPEVVTAPGAGTPAEIGVYSQQWRDTQDRGTRVSHFLAFEPTFVGGATVATGQLDADANFEIAVGSGPGRPAEVRIFDAAGSRIGAFVPFEPTYTGGVQVAAGDRDRDGIAELAIVTETGPPRVRIVTAAGAVLQTLQPAGYEHGARVALADLAGDGEAELVLAPRPGGAPWITLLSPTGATLARFAGYDEPFTGGLHVAAGDLDDDGRDEIVVTPGSGSQTDVRIFKVSETHIARRTRVFSTFDWRWPGLEVAVRTRVGPPLTTSPRTVSVRPSSRRSFVVAAFRDALGPRDAVGSFAARVEWGSGARSAATVSNPHNNGLYQVRTARRFTRPGRYAARVVITDTRGRFAVAHTTVVVSRR